MLEFEIGIVSAFLTMLINYCIGKPGSKEFSPYEIFSGYTVWLAKWRLKQVGLFDQYKAIGIENSSRLKTLHELINFKNDFNKMIYEAAEPFFTWERAAGMCPVCTGVWVSLFSGLYFTKDFIHLLTIVVTSHIVIRILNKIL